MDALAVNVDPVDHEVSLHEGVWAQPLELGGRLDLAGPEPAGRRPAAVTTADAAAGRVGVGWDLLELRPIRILLVPGAFASDEALFQDSEPLAHWSRTLQARRARGNRAIGCPAVPGHTAAMHVRARASRGSVATDLAS